MPSSALLEIALRGEPVAPGHRLCGGCGAGVINGFENVAATIGGVEAAYEAMRRRGDLPVRQKDDKGRR